MEMFPFFCMYKLFGQLQMSSVNFMLIPLNLSDKEKKLKFIPYFPHVVFFMLSCESVCFCIVFKFCVMAEL